MKRIPRAALLLVVAPWLLAAAEPRPDEFGWGWRIGLAEDASFHRVALPREVLAAAQSPALTDVAVFDDDDRPMPSFLAEPDLTPVPEPAPVAVPLFETVERLAARAPRADLQVQARGDGSFDATLSVEPGGAPPADGPRRWYAMLGDAELERRWSAARFGWQAAGEPQVVNLELAVSDDLQYWRPVASGAVAYLVSGPATLKRDSVPLVGQLGRYLRITAVTAPAGWRLDSLALLPAAERAEPERQWAEEPVRAGQTALEVDLGGAIRIDRFDLVLDEGVGLVRVRLSSAAEAGGPWTERGEALFYRLAGEVEALSTPASLAPVAARHWRAELIGHNGARARLRLGWLPTDLVFVAQGRAPYRLVAGSAAQARAPQPLGADARGLWSAGTGVTGVAHLGPRFELAGERALRPSLTRDWRSHLLWALLGFGVLAVLWMAAQLLREMKRG